MKKIYIFITFILNYFLYLYLFFRILKKKECPIRYKEKLCISSQYKTNKFLIWFHCSSIGELKSIFPIIDYYLKKNVGQILITTSTLGSNDVFQKKYRNINIRIVENQIFSNSNSSESTRIALNNISNDKILLCYRSEKTGFHFI